MIRIEFGSAHDLRQFLLFVFELMGRPDTERIAKATADLSAAEQSLETAVNNQPQGAENGKPSPS